MFQINAFCPNRIKILQNDNKDVVLVARNVVNKIKSVSRWTQSGLNIIFISCLKQSNPISRFSHAHHALRTTSEIQFPKMIQSIFCWFYSCDEEEEICLEATSLQISKTKKNQHFAFLSEKMKKKETKDVGRSLCRTSKFQDKYLMHRLCYLVNML